MKFTNTVAVFAGHRVKQKQICAWFFVETNLTNK